MKLFFFFCNDKFNQNNIPLFVHRNNIITRLSRNWNNNIKYEFYIKYNR